MKRAGIIILTAVILVLSILLSLISCGDKLSGVYVRSDGEVSYSFEGGNFTLYEEGKIKMKGTYAIDDKQIIFRYEDMGQKYKEPLPFEKSDDGLKIKIGSVEFSKKVD